MLDINFIRKEPDVLKDSLKKRGLDERVIDDILKVDESRRKLIQEIDLLRSARKKTKDIREGTDIKVKIKDLESKLATLEKEFESLMIKIPNILAPDTPIGKDDKENVVVSQNGKLPEFDFTPKTHIEIGKELDILDLERGVKVAGFRGYYLKNEGAMLALSLMFYALNKMIEKGYTPIIPPTLVKEFALFGSGYFKDLKYNPKTDEIYQVNTEDEEKRFLVGTAEPSLLAYYANEILEEKDLPIKLCGFSQCYRSEIGSYGKDTKGIYRVHEFMKVEQVVLSKADIKESDKLQQEMVSITEEIHRDLELPYRLVRICSGDLSLGKYKQFDYEVWMPGLNRWGETGSASNFLDWQARRLNIKYKTASGEKKYVYMLNNTALPTPRPIIAILENFQQKDGSVIIPEKLQKYFGKTKISKEK